MAAIHGRLTEVGVRRISIPPVRIHLLALGIVTQGLGRLHGRGTHPLILYRVKFAVCVAVGRVFFQFCERPFMDTRQRQARREAAGRAET